MPSRTYTNDRPPSSITMLYSQQLRVNYRVSAITADPNLGRKRDGCIRHASANYRSKMNAFNMPQIEEARSRNGELYHEFIRANRLSVGLYILEAGAADPQTPHTEDEIYYIVSGSAIIQVAGEDRPVSAGSVIYVDELVDHRFHTITEELKVIVVFAPPRRSRAAQS